MTTIVNTHAAKTHFSELVDRVLAGEDIVIARAGKPVVRLVAVTPARTPLLGAMAGQIWIADDFDEPDAEIEAAFYDEPLLPQADAPAP